jgi:hypothetical protein
MMKAPVAFCEGQIIQSSLNAHCSLQNVFAWNQTLKL